MSRDALLRLGEGCAEYVFRVKKAVDYLGRAGIGIVRPDPKRGSNERTISYEQKQQLGQQIRIIDCILTC